MNTLPSCPCGSQKQYEDCCFKKKGDDGAPLFYKGAIIGDDKGNWHPLPNVRFAVTLMVKEADKHREYAKDLVIKSKLPETYRDAFINNYGIFYESYEELLKSLKKTSGKGVSFQTDTVEIRKLWRDFLFNGRILCDFIGLHSKTSLGLNQEVGGLNRKKYSSLLKILQKQELSDKKLIEVKIQLEKLKENVLRFIDARNREKISGKTIVEFPTTDSEYGVIKGGKINVDGSDYDMIEFVVKSYESLYKLTLVLLGVCI